MKKKSIEKLTEYLDSECSDYGMSYNYEWIEDCGFYEVEILREHSDLTACVRFKYNDDKDELLIELTEDSWCVSEHFEWTVKYFWMIVSPQLFPEN